MHSDLPPSGMVPPKHQWACRATTLSFYRKLKRDADEDRVRGNAVGDDFEVAVPQLHRSWNVERGRDHSIAGRHPHAAVIVRPSIEDVPRTPVGDPDQGIVGGRLSIVPVGRP